MRLPAALLFLALTAFVAAATVECGSPVAPPNWGVGSDKLNRTSTRPDSSVVVVDGQVELRDGSAEGAMLRYLDSSAMLAP
jgi:hypothetical protein